MRILPKIDQVNERQHVAFAANAINGNFSGDENEYDTEGQTIKLSPMERINELKELNVLRSYFVSIASDNYRKSYRSVNAISNSGKLLKRKLKLNSLKELLASFLY